MYIQYIIKMPYFLNVLIHDFQIKSKFSMWVMQRVCINSENINMKGISEMIYMISSFVKVLVT